MDKYKSLKGMASVKFLTSSFSLTLLLYRLLDVAKRTDRIPLVSCRKVKMLSEISEEMDVASIIDSSAALQMLKLMPYFPAYTCNFLISQMVSMLVQLNHLCANPKIESLVEINIIIVHPDVMSIKQ